MVITINTKKVTNFVRRHKGTIVVTCIAVIVVRAQGRDNRAMMQYITDKDLMNDYCDTH